MHSIPGKMRDWKKNKGNGKWYQRSLSLRFDKIRKKSFIVKGKLCSSVFDVLTLGDY